MKKRKKYNPRKLSAYRGTGILPHILVKAATSKAAIEPEEIIRITAPYMTAVDHIRTGQCTEQEFWNLLQNHYLYIHLLATMKSLENYSDDPEYDMLARLEIQTAFDTATEKTTETIDSIGTRKKQHGKFIATGEELKNLTDSLDKFKAILGIANYAHYIQAYKNSEPIIDSIAHRHNKRIKAENTTTKFQTA